MSDRSSTRSATMGMTLSRDIVAHRMEGKIRCKAPMCVRWRQPFRKPYRNRGPWPESRPVDPLRNAPVAAMLGWPPPASGDSTAV
jgi:hypothetical protein